MTVSILIPCYNARRFVRQSVESALDQTWRDLEVIVVDDGSNDGSWEVLSQLRDSRLRVIQQENRGQCAAANRAYSHSCGDLIKFFDADDVLAPDHIERQVERLGGRHDAVALGEITRFRGAEPNGEDFVRLPMYRDANPADWLAAEWMNAQPMMQCGLWLIPRPILETAGLWDERLSLINDFEFFSRVLLASREIVFAPGARIYYRSAVIGSLSGQRTRSAVESAFLSLMLGVDHLLAAEDSPWSRLACANILQGFDYEYFPEHADLRAKVRKRVKDLGGANITPIGPPRFHALRRLVGWQFARRIQRLVGR